MNNNYWWQLNTLWIVFGGQFVQRALSDRYDARTDQIRKLN